MIRAVAPHMKKGGSGGVVNVSSIAGVMGSGSSIAYAASKGALNTMTLSLARALGPEIRVKTDKRDAIHLARLLHLDEYTAVSVPTIGAESARDLVRAPEQC